MVTVVIVIYRGGHGSYTNYGGAVWSAYEDP